MVIIVSAVSGWGTSAFVIISISVVSISFTVASVVGVSSASMGVVPRDLHVCLVLSFPALTTSTQSASGGDVSVMVVIYILWVFPPLALSPSFCLLFSLTVLVEAVGPARTDFRTAVTNFLGVSLVA